MSTPFQEDPVDLVLRVYSQALGLDKSQDI